MSACSTKYKEKLLHTRFLLEQPTLYGITIIIKNRNLLFLSMKTDHQKNFLSPKDTTITNIYYLCAWKYGNIQDYLAELFIITPETNYCIPLYYLYRLVSFFLTICFILCEHVVRKAQCFSVELHVFPPKYRAV